MHLLLIDPFHFCLLDTFEGLEVNASTVNYLFSVNLVGVLGKKHSFVSFAYPSRHDLNRMPRHVTVDLILQFASVERPATACDALLGGVQGSKTIDLMMSQ
jgi:hypothetical protein